MKLSDRLMLIADEVNFGETMADIGTDHGFLPLYLLESGKSPFVIMADISKGSLDKAEANCKLANPKGPYELRLGNGIDVLKPGEVDVVAIAGMGGILISDILDWDLVKSKSIKRYIFQPRNKVGRLRHYLYTHGFKIVKESLVRESRFICEILTVEAPAEGDAPFDANAPYTADFDYPDTLLDFKNDLTLDYLKMKLELEQDIYDNILKNSKNADESGSFAKDRVLKIESLIKSLEESNGEE